MIEKMEKEIKRIIVLRGIPGSGKTTWAKKWVQENKKGRIRINWDDLRNMFGAYWVTSREVLVVTCSRHILDAAMKSGYDIVIDNTNISGIETYKAIADAFNNINHNYTYQVEEKLFDTDLKTCIERDKNRDRTVGAGVINRMYKQLHKIK
jgi:predicted kinase